VSALEALELDSQARRQALNVQRSLLLQAPAGSGKTTVLTARFLALLTVVDAPEQILAITFTRKAAAEMHHRILEALQAAETGAPISGLDPTLLQAVAQRDRTLGWQLLRNAARLRVETIDALNHRLASALPIAARSGTQLTLTPTPEPLYRRAARHALRGALEDPEASAAAELLLDRLDNSWRRLEQLLADMLGRRSHWLPRVLEARASGIAERVAESVDAVLRSSLAGAAASLPAALLHEGEQLLALRQPGGAIRLSADPASLPHWRALCALAMTNQNAWRRRLSVREGYETHERDRKQRVLDWIGAMMAHEGALPMLCALRGLPDATPSPGDHAAIEALAQLLMRGAAELQLLFAEQGVVDYPFVAAAARQALTEQGEPSDFALRAGGAIRHILVDEFQDTSFEQFRLLNALTVGWERGDGRTLFLVGDPMQSIYQFREAEVGLFLRARDHGLGSVQLSMLQLRRNFRSRAGVIEWINRRFERLFPRDDDARLAAVRYLPSVPAQAEDLAEHAPVSLHRLLPGDRIGEAVRVLEIVRAERQRDASTRIAILVAAREHASAIVSHLRDAGFALRGVDLEPLRERPLIRDLSALTRALLHGADRTAWLALLRAPWCGLPLAQIEAVLAAADGDLFAALSAAVRDGQDPQRRITRLCAALAPASLGAERGWPLWQRVLRSWMRLGGPAIYPDVAERLDARRFFDALAEHDDPASLVGERMDSLTERLYSTAPPQTGAIEVMTMHAAKGLEWDVVILPGLGRRGAHETDPLLHWIELPRPAEGTDLLLAPIRSNEEEPDGSLAPYIKSLKRARKALERVRQLYVATTRARLSLHLLAAADARTRAGEPAAPAPGSLLATLWPAIDEQFRALQPAGNTPGNTRGPAALAAPTLTRLPEQWVMAMPPDPPVLSRLLLSSPLSAGAPEYSWVGSTARAIGTIVHAELRRLAAMHVLPAPQDLDRRASRYGSWLAELGVPPDERPVAEARILEALERTLADPRGRWLLSGAPGRAHSEWRLSGLHEGRIVNVVFDRMLLDEHGERWVIDFKTSRHEGGGIEAFISQEVERYGPQLRRYAALAEALGQERVRVALYFPLLGVFRELATPP
jgi:ATP-dependent exoDNAse (exonuclease V) beta subunit